jgi:hypothetical protein
VCVEITLCMLNHTVRVEIAVEIILVRGKNTLDRFEITLVHVVIDVLTFFYGSAPGYSR